MHILMVAARCYPFMGGIETHIHEVGPRLVARGHHIDVLTTDPSGELPVEEDVRGMRVRRVPAWPKKLDLYWAPAVYSAIRRGGWDVVHFQGYNTFVAPTGLLAAVRNRLPFVLTFHSGGHSSRLRNAVRRPQRALLRPLVSKADRLIGVSQFEADFFSEQMGIPKERFSIVPNGAAMPQASRGVEPDPYLIVSSGRLERYKGHHRVIEAMPELIRRVPAARLRVVGKGPYEDELHKLVNRLGLQSHVTIELCPEPSGRRWRIFWHAPDWSCCSANTRLIRSPSWKRSRCAGPFSSPTPQAWARSRGMAFAERCRWKPVRKSSPPRWPRNCRPGGSSPTWRYRTGMPARRL